MKMTKAQKVWLSIFSAMVLLPELLWSPVGNIIYEFFQGTSNVQPYRHNFLMNPDNGSFLSFILFIQFLGCLLLFIYIYNHKKNNIIFWLKILLMTSLTIITFFIFFMSITIGNHGIGF